MAGGGPAPCRSPDEKSGQMIAKFTGFGTPKCSVLEGKSLFAHFV